MFPLDDERARRIAAVPDGSAATERATGSPAGPAASTVAASTAPPSTSAAPVPAAPTSAVPAKPAAGRAGRNLPAAIAVGLTLGAVVVASLFVWRPAFLAVVLATVLAILVWRIGDGPAGYQRDTAAAVLIAVYVPFLAGFAVLLARPADGDLRVLCTLAGVVLSDTGGYFFGALFGRHPMAPSVSPKKSWEGLAGSLVATGVGAALLLYYLLDVPWWYGALFGLAVAAASVLGDLAESLLK